MTDPSKNRVALFQRKQLEIAAAELERDFAQGRWNPFSMRSLGNVARWLGHTDIEGRALRLLNATPDSVFVSGVTANFELTPDIVTLSRTLTPLANLETDYRPFHVDAFLESLNSSSAKHRALCFQRQYKDAYAAAGSGLPLEELGVVLAVMGEFEEAARIACDPSLETFRRENIRFVILLEKFRQGDWEGALSALKQEFAGQLGIEGRLHIVLVLAGREPWGGYPFPDW